MFNKKQYFKNASINNLAFLFSIAVTFFLTPLVVQTLGDEFYGYWTLIVSFTGYFGFLDFGVRAGVGQYVTRYLAKQDYNNFNKVIKTSLTVLCCIGLVGLFLSIITAVFFTQDLFSISQDIDDFKVSLFLVGLAISLKFPSVVFQTILNGIHRYDLTGLISIICKAANGIFIYGALKGGYGFLGLAWVTLFTQLLEGALMLFLAKLKVPETKVSLGFNSETLKEVSGYGIFSFLANIADQITFYISPLLIGKQLGAVSVTYYCIAGNLMPYLISLIRAVSSPLMQVATGYDATGNDESNKRLFVYGTRYVFWLVGLVALNIYIVGDKFLGTWIGEKYVSVGPIPSSGYVMKILLFGYIAFLFNAVGRQILFGKRRNRFLAYINMLCAAGVIIISLFVLEKFHIVGAAWAVVIPLIVVNGIVLPVYTAKITGVSYAEFIYRTLVPVSFIFIISVFIIDYLMVMVTHFNWFSIFSSCVVSTGLYLLFSLVIYSKDLKEIISRRKISKVGS